MKKITYIVLLAFLIALTPSSLLVFASENNSSKPIHFADRDVIVVGSFDCWLHADGKTWQDTDHDGIRDVPGDGKVKECRIVVSIPEDLKAQYDNVTYKIIPFNSDMPDSEMQTLFSRAKGGYHGQAIPEFELKACPSYDEFYAKILRFRADDYKAKPNTTDTTTFLFPFDKNKVMNVKKDWQSELTEGRRALMPVLVEFWGTPKKQEPLKPKPPTKKGCADQPSISNTWDELYTWKVRHDDIIEVTDPETGKTTLEPYTWYEDKSEIVEYQETLSASLSVNTKQGIATDPKRPKESDRESRGSWEIIPYAKKKGLDPNEVTRAGYGFEVKVETSYSNDWETKVPEGAKPHGGKFSGPTEVTVEFYNTKGRFVEKVKLVPTKGEAGDNDITWELPRERYKFQSGKVIYERKHYVDLKVPDGKYLVNVTVKGAGKTDLCLVRQKYVTIYGDMFDDDYIRVAR